MSQRFKNYPTPNKSGGDSWRYGEKATVCLDDICAVVPLVNRYHSFRPGQDYCKVYLRSGAEIELLVDAATVANDMKEHK
jgi:hypothetical protein